MINTLPTNATRADRAFRVLLIYKEHEKDDDETAIADLLADLMHLSDEQGVCFRDAHERAERNYEAECCENDNTDALDAHFPSLADDLNSLPDGRDLG